MSRSLVVLLALLAVAIPILSGCGGAGVDSMPRLAKGPKLARGRIAVQVAWPKSHSRVVPTASKSMRIELWSGGAKAAEKLLVAPSTTAVFDTYPIGAVEARVTAYSEADGTGTPVANGTGTGTFAADADASISVTLGSTIVGLSAYPSAHYGFPGDTSDFDVYAVNDDGDTVAEDFADVTAVSDDPTIARVSPMGTVQLLAEGETTITLTDRNSGQTTELQVVVSDPSP